VVTVAGKRYTLAGLRSTIQNPPQTRSSSLSILCADTLLSINQIAVLLSPSYNIQPWLAKPCGLLKRGLDQAARTYGVFSD